MPRWLLPVLAVSVVVLLAVAAKPILFPVGNTHITWENFDRLKVGMQLEEVEAILGRPGDYRTEPTHDRSVIPLSAIPQKDDLIWRGDEATIFVRLGSSGSAGRMVFYGEQPESVGLLDLLRWRWDHWRDSRR